MLVKVHECNQWLYFSNKTIDWHICQPIVSQLCIRVHPITEDGKKGGCPRTLHVEKERHPLYTFSFSQKKLVVQIIYLMEVKVIFFIFLMTACVDCIWFPVGGFIMITMYTKALIRCRDMLKGELIVWNAVSLIKASWQTGAEKRKWRSLMTDKRTTIRRRSWLKLTRRRIATSFPFEVSYTGLSDFLATLSPSNQDFNNFTGCLSELQL